MSDISGAIAQLLNSSEGIMRVNELKRGFWAAAIALVLTGAFVAALVAEVDQSPVNVGLQAGTVHSRAVQPVNAG